MKVGKSNQQPVTSQETQSSGGMAHEFILRGINLTNEEARNHVSFLKDLAPLPGRATSALFTS